jgi:hypothetical protein
MLEEHELESFASAKVAVRRGARFSSSRFLCRVKRSPSDERDLHDGRTCREVTSGEPRQQARLVL